MSTAPHPARQAQEALFDAYVSTTGLEIHLTGHRRFELKRMVEMGITPEEVVTVLKWIEKKIARGDSGFGETSLDFRNAMQADRMDELVAKLRQQRARAKGARPRPVVARVDKLPDGSTVSRLDTAPPLDPTAKSLKEMVAEAMGKRE